MKRWIALLLGAGAALVLSAGPVAAKPGTGMPPAAPQPTAPPRAVPTTAIGLVLADQNSTGLAATIDAGQSEEHDIVVSNHTNDLRLTVKLTSTDATGVLGAGPGSWVSFADDAVQLEPHSAVTVPMTIAVPHDTQPGAALAKVTATVESAVAAADGAPRTGSARVTLPLSITVGGSATATVAIADVHRVDSGNQHELALVLRNFGNQTAHVTGHVRVAGDHPQTLKVAADLAAARDTTVTTNWNATPVGTPTDVAVDVEYNNGDVASWSSTLGAAPVPLSQQGDNGNAASSTPTTFSSDAGNNAGPATTTPTQASNSSAQPKQWWESGFMPVLIVIALILAGLWFVFEMRSSRRRGDEMPMPGFFMPPGWIPNNNNTDASGELAKQLVKLTEIIVSLTTQPGEVRQMPARARSPDDEPVETVEARAGPSPGDRDPPVAARDPDITSERLATEALSLVRSAPEAPGEPARPKTEVSEADQQRSEVMQRLQELDRERRRLRAWMDHEDAGAGLDWPTPPEFEGADDQTRPDNS